MVTITTQKKYKEIVERQDKLELELNLLKKAVLEDKELNIKPSVLKKWERISKDLDNGKGRFFNSPEAARKWLKTL